MNPVPQPKIKGPLKCLPRRNLWIHVCKCQNAINSHSFFLDHCVARINGSLKVFNKFQSHTLQKASLVCTLLDQCQLSVEPQCCQYGNCLKE